MTRYVFVSSSFVRTKVRLTCCGAHTLPLTPLNPPGTLGEPEQAEVLRVTVNIRLLPS